MSKEQRFLAGLERVFKADLARLQAEQRVVLHNKCVTRAKLYKRNVVLERAIVGDFQLAGSEAGAVRG